LCPILSPL